jgi:hypothetical protein
MEGKSSGGKIKNVQQRVRVLVQIGSGEGMSLGNLDVSLIVD